MKLFKAMYSLGLGAVKAVKENATKAFIAVGTFVGVSATPARADFASDLTSLQTQATTDLGAISTSQVAIMAVVFGLIALGIAFKWITRTGKSA